MKTLIAYATNSGTAKKAAGMINDKLKTKADIVNLDEDKVPDISDYDFVLIGGSMMMGKIQHSVKRFIKKNKKELEQTRMGFFLACGFPENLSEYFKVILGDLVDRAEVLSNIGYAYYFEKAKPMAKQVMISIAKVEKTVEALDEKEIKRVAETING